MSSAIESKRPIEILPRDNHTATVIFFHGLGDQGEGWADSFRYEFAPHLPNFKFVCPNSANRPVTLNFGMNMPAWYDLKGLSVDAPEDKDGIQAATNYAHELVENEIAAGIPSNRIFLGGFSMGAALAIYAGLTNPNTLGGIVSLSGFLLCRNELPGEHKANLSTPIFMGHGSDDFLVPLQFGQMTESALKAFNSNVRMIVYPGLQHSSSPQELSDAVAFLQANTA